MTRICGRVGWCGIMPGGGWQETRPDPAAAGSDVFADRYDSPDPIASSGFYLLLVHKLSQGGGGPAWGAIWIKNAAFQRRKLSLIWFVQFPKKKHHILKTFPRCARLFFKKL